MRNILSTAIAALVASVVAVFAANTTFFTSIGDTIFPFSPPAGANAGTIDNMTIGATTPRAINATTLGASGLASLNASARIDTGTKTVTAAAGAATLNKLAGVITTEALTTAAVTDYTLTLTNSTIAAADQVFVSIGNGTNTQGDPVHGVVTPGAGTATIVVRNAHATQALNGTLTIAFAVFKN